MFGYTDELSMYRQYRVAQKKSGPPRSLWT